MAHGLRSTAPASVAPEDPGVRHRRPSSAHRAGFVPIAPPAVGGGRTGIRLTYRETVIDEIRTASESFWHFLSDIAILPLLAAIGCHLLKLCCTSRAWRNVLAAAYPDRPVRWPPILAAYVSGVGINAIVPARGGDVVRIFLAHRAIPAARTPRLSPPPSS